MLRRLGVMCVLIGFLVVVASPTAGATVAAQVQHSTVRSFADGSVIQGARAILVRGSRWIAFHLHTRLPAGDANTVWYVIFNDPSKCSDPAGPGLSCGLGDVDPSSPAQVSVLNADGLVVGQSGVANFTGWLAVGGSGPGQVLFGNGITNPLGAEVHLLVEDHGVASSDPAILYAQTHEDGGGCPPNECPILQDATFAAA